MDPVQYYTTTLSNAFKTLGPYLAFLVGGYLIFIKLPFLFLKKNMDVQKKRLQEENMALEAAKASAPKQKIIETKTERKEAPKQEKKQEQKREQKKEEVKKPLPRAPVQSPEEVLGLKPNEAFTKSELKKRYFDLLKQNHPDRVATLGQDFKSLAEKNTKEINRAYEKLKNRAA